MFGGQLCQKGMLSFSLDLPKHLTCRPDHPRGCYRCVCNMGDFLAPCFRFYEFNVSWSKCWITFFPSLFPYHVPFPAFPIEDLSKSSFIYAANLVCHTRAALLWAHYAWIRFINCKTWRNSLPFTSLTFLWLENIEQWWLWLPGMMPGWKLKFWSFLCAKRG